MSLGDMQRSPKQRTQPELCRQKPARRRAPQCSRRSTRSLWHPRAANAPPQTLDFVHTHRRRPCIPVPICSQPAHTAQLHLHTVAWAHLKKKKKPRDLYRRDHSGLVYIRTDPPRLWSIPTSTTISSSKHTILVDRHSILGQTRTYAHGWLRSVLY